MRIDAEKASELASVVTGTREALLALLTPEQQKSRQARWHSNPKEVAWTFEDSAQLLASQGNEPVKAALRLYQHAVNALWLYLHSCEVAEKLASMWARKHRDLAKTIPREDLEAEILFMLRDAIRRFDPSKGSIMAYVPTLIFGDLLEWARQQQSVVTRPRDAVLRKQTPPADTGLTTDESGRSGNNHGSKRQQAQARAVRRPSGLRDYAAPQGAYKPNEEALLELIDKDRDAQTSD